MDVRFSEEELLLRDSVLGQAEKLVPDTVQGLEGYDDRVLWERLASAGLLALGLPEALGGAGNVTDVAIVLQALGRVFAPVPYLGGAVLPGQLLAAAGVPPATLAPLVAGELRVAVGLNPVSFDLSVEGDDGVLAWDAAGAAAALVASRDGSGRLVAVALQGPTPGLDLTRQARWCDTGRRVDIGDLGGPVGFDARRRWHALALAAVASDMVGVMEGALRLAVDYAAGREQFGVPIGSFQAIQHLLAEQHVNLEGARSLTVYAAWALEHRGLDDAALAAHTAKAYCSEVGKQLCEAVSQVHGGMGMTWECRAQVFLRRMMADRGFLGDEKAHYREIAMVRKAMVGRGL